MGTIVLPHCICCVNNISTACCPEPLSKTLHAFLVSLNNCPCATGTTVTLVYDPVTDSWNGTGAWGTCGENVILKMFCDTTELPVPLWKMTISFSDGCRPPETKIAVIADCSPPNFNFGVSDLSLICGCNADADFTFGVVA